MTNAEWMIKNGYKFSDLCYCFISDDGVVNFYMHGEIVGRVPSLSYFEALKEWLDMKHVEPILNDAEREYLKTVLKPFHENVAYVEKVHYYPINGDTSSSLAFLFIKLHDGKLEFPNFDSRRMYLGMELHKKYTLDELGITYEEKDE